MTAKSNTEGVSFYRIGIQNEMLYSQKYTPPHRLFPEILKFLLVLFTLLKQRIGIDRFPIIKIQLQFSVRESIGIFYIYSGFSIKRTLLVQKKSVRMYPVNWKAGEQNMLLFCY